MSVSEKGAGNIFHCNLPFFFIQQGPDSSIALGNAIVVWKTKTYSITNLFELIVVAFEL